MASSSVLKARIAQLLGAGLAIAGFLQALLFASRSLFSTAIPDPLVNALPQPPAALLVRMHKITWIPEGLHLALVAALLGVALIAIGGLIFRSQARTLQAQKIRREDARRRVHHYRDSVRIEPT